MVWHVRGAGQFETPAVFFDGVTEFKTESLISGNDGVLSFSFWFRVAEDISIDAYPVLFVAAPEFDETFPPYRSNLNVYFTHPDLLYFGVHTHGSEEHPDLPLPASQFYSPNGYSPGDWHHVLCCVQQSASGPIRPARLYIDDVDVTTHDPEFGENVAGFTMTLSGVTFHIGSNGVTSGGPPTWWFRGDLSELWIASGQNLLVGEEIPEETRRKFITADGRPVSLGMNGELPTGVAPTIFGHGNRRTFLQPNLGTGGEFALIGELTDAETHPRVGAP